LQNGNDSPSTSIIHIAIPQIPVQYVSVWNDILPLDGNTQYKSSSSTVDGVQSELHEIFDSHNKLIIRRESEIKKPSISIDGMIYVNELYKKFEQYIFDILDNLRTIVQNNGS
jgi:hypothetical protein